VGDALEDTEEVLALREVLKSDRLGHQHRIVLTHRTLKDEGRMALDEVGKLIVQRNGTIGVTKERARQIEDEAKGIIREELKSYGITS
jgi:DNA-directed RNA polymerase sigma subunit (sigma70/sigma32)